MSVDEAVREAAFWVGYQLDASSGVLLRFSGEEDAHDEAPTFTEAEVAARIRDADLTGISWEVAREGLRVSVDHARYWQEPDGEDAVATLPSVRESLSRVASRVGAELPRLTAERRQVQWAVDWRAVSDSAPLQRDPASVLADWTRNVREEEDRAARERPADPRANVSGTWWSVPTRLLATRAGIRDALELVEDSLGWEVATVIPVRGAGRTLEIRSPEDWADLCREYPTEVTASRRHDWFRVTGRDGRWLIPDWERVAQRWDAVHLTTLGYLSAATELIEVDAEYATVIAGWAPDSTIWLRDVAREWSEPRQEWTRPQSGARWAPLPSAYSATGDRQEH